MYVLEAPTHCEGDVEACTTVSGVLFDSVVDTSLGGDFVGAHSLHSAPSTMSCGEMPTLPFDPRGLSKDNPLVMDLIEDGVSIHSMLFNSSSKPEVLHRRLWRSQ